MTTEESREVAEALREVLRDLCPAENCLSCGRTRRGITQLVEAVRKDERERAGGELNATIDDIMNQFTAFSGEGAAEAYERDRGVYSFPIKRRDYLLGWEGAVYREHVREKLAAPAEGGTEG